VNEGHALVIPKRHVADFFELAASERNACFELVAEVKAKLETRFLPDGYNVGINVGAAAGQTIFHVHIHVIPRYTGDVASPRGGVRGVIPSKQSY
jgi:diadenosine tetraphosphate (Ap4A) HIT family hydrolase